jgi:hypothetical protein
MRFKKSVLWTEADDQCNDCKHHNRCALQDALTQGVVTMTAESLGVTACQTYEPRALRLI